MSNYSVQRTWNEDSMGRIVHRMTATIGCPRNGGLAVTAETVEDWREAQLRQGPRKIEAQLQSYVMAHIRRELFP